MATFFLLLGFLIHEYNIDNFHHNVEDTYRVLQWNNMANNYDLNNSAKVSDYLSNNYPSVARLTHIVYPGWQFLKANEASYQEKRVLVVDSSFFKIFDYEFLSGNSENSLDKPYSVVLTQSVFKKYFGKSDPYNKVIFIKDQAYNVTGILADLNGSSHLRFDILISSSSFEETRRGFLYLTLTAGSDAKDFNRKINQDYKKIASAKSDSKVAQPFKLESLKDSYYTFPQNYQSDVFLFRENKSLVVIASTMSILLFIASFNFINFSQARVIFRTTEITVYRIFGANIAAAQVFILETFFLSSISLIICAIISLLILPYFNTLFGSYITPRYLVSLPIICISVAIFVVITTFLGFLAYLIYAKINVRVFLNSDRKVQPKPIKLLNSLVIVQLAISILLALVSVSVREQILFIENSSLGFNTKNVIDVNMMNLDSVRNPKLFKNELLRIPDVISASVCMGTPLDGRGYTNIEIDGETTELNFVAGDLDYINTIGFQVIAGRQFKSTSDSSYSLLNEAALKYYKLDKNLQPTDGQSTSKVIGLVKDFHFKSFKERITPMEIRLVETSEINPFGAGRMLIHTRGDDKSIIAKIEKAWSGVYRDSPFEFSFISDTYYNIYEKERKQSSLIIIGCLISISITLFGLIGLSIFGAHRRLKEIAIRKIYGASVNLILTKSITQALSWTIIGSILAIPFAVYFTRNWLDNFAYKAEPRFELYITVILVAAFVTGFSVLYQTMIVARRNPSDTLKYE